MDYLRYYLATVVVGAGILGFALGGYWVWLGIGTFIPLLIVDVLSKPDLKTRQISIPWLVDVPLYLHLFLMIALYVMFIHWLVSVQASNGSVTTINLIGAILSLGWLGAVPNLPINHELMHRRNPVARLFATLMGTFYADPTRDVAHIHTHHIHLGTPADSDTARRGETVYTFVFRATFGALKDFFVIEQDRCKKMKISFFSPKGRIFKSILQSGLLVALAGWFAGIQGAFIASAGIIFAKLLVEMFNYYQHYGLVRVEGTKYDVQHIWNHLTPVDRQLAFEITNHNDHHMDSYMPFYKLTPKPDGPQMPSILLCFLSGLVPPIWFNFIAKPRLKEWDMKFATEGEKELAREANKKAGWPDWLGEVEAA